jgi:hypothetical protein
MEPVFAPLARANTADLGACPRDTIDSTETGANIAIGVAADTGSICTVPSDKQLIAINLEICFPNNAGNLNLIDFKGCSVGVIL